MRELVERILSGEVEATLLGIGPMTETVIEAALELGRDEGFPVIFIASRNQIDSKEFGGGYVMGWDQREFVGRITRAAKEAGFKGPLYICRDHGGPWQRDEEMKGKLSPDEAMARAKRSFEEDIKAGFHLLHIDPTKDPHIGPPVPLKIVMERTIELLRFTSRIGDVEYEIGTEETSGGLTDPEVFERFIRELLGKLESEGLKKPCFIVGQTGTLVRMDENVGRFDPEKARQLAGIAAKYGIGFKEHNADYLPEELLRMHPQLGITAANVAPEFGVAETKAYLKLADMERRAAEEGRISSPSGFDDVLMEAAFKSGRWRKWLKEEMKGLSDEEILSNPELLRKVTEISGHYVLSDEEVMAARRRMFDNLRSSGALPDPEGWVRDRVKEAIMKYVEAFNLKGLVERM
ncbi:sugar-phosphate kinase [Candidatus Poribacteria bacterium]|nr:MAG: sugar-phosphate kinase [Candidatus Poribacteria bacterium]